MVENLMKEIHVLEGLQQAEHLRMLNGYGLQSTKIGHWQWELEADLGIPKSTVSKNLTQDLAKKYVIVKFVPQLLLPEQKEHCAAEANDVI